ncbi:hypothetical protein AGABI1DRAFT_114413, partial [Agaricus bisporus var. burnettii JB137-S8]
MVQKRIHVLHRCRTFERRPEEYDDLKGFAEFLERNLPLPRHCSSTVDIHDHDPVDGHAIHMLTTLVLSHNTL